MALVSYSDSEESEAEDQKFTIIPAAKAAVEKPSKPGFQKLINQSNPHKIKVNLSENNRIQAKSKDDEEAGRPEKRARMETGGVGGFNAMLPAPKKAAPSPSTSASSTKKGLGSGISLKTGAAPSFSRELQADAEPKSESHGYNGNLDALESSFKPDFAESKPASDQSESVKEEVEPRPQKIGNSMMFKPLSVARKPQKKKQASQPTAKAGDPKSSASGTAGGAPKAPPKVSLFNMADPGASTTSQSSSTSLGEYQPYFPESNGQQEDAAVPDAPLEPDVSAAASAASAKPPQAQSLTALASSLNLTPSQRRQLLGRHAADRDVAVVNFNADAEYNANEELRTATEAGGAQQHQHNPVRAIAPGKHSLKQLVNAVAGQRDALEESFASGKRNRKEAGSKYGW